MILAASLGSLVRKAYGKETAATVAIQKIIDTLSIDPAISNVDVVIIGDKDLSGLDRGRVIAAINNKHSNINVAVFIAPNNRNVNERDFHSAGVTVSVVKKVVPQDITDVVEKMLSGKVVAKGTVPISEKTEIFEGTAFSGKSGLNTGTTAPKAEPKVEERKPTIEEILAEKEKNKIIEMELPKAPEVPKQEVPKELPKVEVAAPLVEKKELSIEDRIRNMNMFSNYNEFQNFLKTEKIKQELIEENTKYASSLSMLETLDKQIVAIFRADDKTTNEKFDEIRQAAMSRIGYKEVVNNILAEKIYNVINAAVSSAQDAVEKKVEKIKASIDQIAENAIKWQDQDKLNNLIKERLELQVELSQALDQVYKLFSILNKTSTSVMSDLNTDLPTSNDYINSVIQTGGSQFSTSNAASVSNTILKALAEGQVKLSAIEVQLQNLIQLIFRLCEKDNTVIEYQQQLINLLQAQRVEDVVIVDTILKSCLRVFIGPDYVGTRTTALMWAGVMSRRNNVVLIDLTGRANFKNYGIESVSLTEFMNERIQKPFLAVEGTVADVDKLQLLLKELKSRLNYYPYITLIFNAEQIDYLNTAIPDTLAVHFVTDASARSVNIMKSVVSRAETHNVAKKLVVINPTRSAAAIAQDIDVDLMSTRVITIPTEQRLQQYEASKSDPTHDMELRMIFEEAFK